MTVLLKPPYVYFGGKQTIAPAVWERLGQVQNFVDPFMGSAAMLLACPNPAPIETVNDAWGFVPNFWRAVHQDPDTVAEYADQPVMECNMHAQHIWLVNQAADLQAKLEGDPDYYDAKIAGWWVWGMSVWIGGGFCSGNGPWVVEEGRMVKRGEGGGVKRKLPHLGDAGRGINRKRPHLGDAGRGINRKRPHLGSAGRGIKAERGDDIRAYTSALSERFRNVRVCCGDWSRVCGPSVTITHGLTAVFLDPPYPTEAGRSMDLYTQDCGSVAHDAHEWALEWGQHPLMRIAFCGYDGTHEFPSSWECLPWHAQGGMANLGNGAGKANRKRECIWFSPGCLKVGLFGGEE